MTDNSSVATHDSCVKKEKKPTKRKPRKKKKPEDFYLNLEVFRDKENRKYLFEMYKSLPISATQREILRFFHGCYYKGNRNEISPYMCSIAEQANVSKRWAKKLIDQFIGMGILIVEDRFDPKKKLIKQISSVYHFTKLMDYYHQIAYLKKAIHKRNIHIHGFHITPSMRENALKRQKKDSERVEKLETELESMKEQILALPKRASSVKAKKIANERAIETTKKTSKKETQKSKAKSQSRVKESKKSSKVTKKKNESSECLENSYLSLGGCPRSHPGGEAEDTQTGKLNGNRKNHSIKAPEYNCNSSVEDYPLWTGQKDLLEIFEFYEKTFGKNLDEAKKTEFQIFYNGFKLTKDEVIRRLQVFSSNFYLYRSTTSINRVFFYFQTLEAASKLKEKINSAQSQFSPGLLDLGKIERDKKFFYHIDEIWQFYHTPLPDTHLLKRDSLKVSSSQKSASTEAPASESSSLKGEEQAQKPVKNGPKTTISEQYDQIKREDEAQKAKESKVASSKPQKPKLKNDSLVKLLEEQTGLMISPSKESDDERLLKLLAKASGGKNTSMYRERVLHWHTAPEDWKKLAYEKVKTGSQMINFIKCVEEKNHASKA